MSALTSTSTANLPQGNRGPQLIALLWVLTSVAGATVVARFVFRARKAVIGWDDIFMLISMLSFIGYSICLTILCVKGGEKHIWQLASKGPQNTVQVQLLNWTAQVFAIFGIACGKVSVSALILAILKDSKALWQRFYLWTFCIVLVMSVAASCSILTFAQCRPTAALWDPRIKGKCMNPAIMADFGTFTGAYNTFVDGSLALIPSSIFFSLQMNLHEKIILSIVFGLNILTAICSGIKTSFLANLANRLDLTWATYDIFAWVTAEFFLVVVCGCLPTLRPLLEFVRNHVGALASNTKQYGTNLSVISTRSGRRTEKSFACQSESAAESASELNSIAANGFRNKNNGQTRTFVDANAIDGSDSRVSHESIARIQSICLTDDNLQKIRVDRSFNIQGGYRTESEPSLHHTEELHRADTMI